MKTTFRFTAIALLLTSAFSLGCADTSGPAEFVPSDEQTQEELDEAENYEKQMAEDAARMQSEQSSN